MLYFLKNKKMTANNFSAQSLEEKTDEVLHNEIKMYTEKILEIEGSTQFQSGKPFSRDRENYRNQIRKRLKIIQARGKQTEIKFSGEESLEVNLEKQNYTRTDLNELIELLIREGNIPKEKYDELRVKSQKPIYRLTYSTTKQPEQEELKL
jgi:hypothetical protein